MKQSLLHTRYRDTLQKYIKYKRRLDKAFQSGRFKGFSKHKQHTLIARVEALRERLASLSSMLKIACGALAMGLMLTPGVALGQTALDTEFQVNSHLPDEQGAPDVAVDYDGDMIITWESKYQDSPGPANIYARVLNSDGTELAADFKVNDNATGSYRNPAVACDSDGNFAIAWESRGGATPYGVYVRLFNPDGSPKSNDISVTDLTTNPIYNVDVAMDADGDFVVVWQYGDDGQGYGIFAQQFTSAGVKTGTPDFRVNNTIAFDQRDPSISMDADGDFVIAWMSQQQDGNGDGVFYQRFDAAGTPQNTTDQQANLTTANGQSEPDVAMDVDGNFIITWQSSTQSPDGDGWGVFFSLWNKDGGRLSGETLVNTTTVNHQREPEVAIDHDGDFTIIFNSYQEDGYYGGIFGQHFSRNCVPIGTQFQVSQEPNVEQRDASIAMDADGDMIIAHASGSRYGNAPVGGFMSEVKGIRYSKIEDLSVPLVTNDEVVNDLFENGQRDPSIASDDLGNHVVVWADENTHIGGALGTDIQGQLFDGNGNRIGANFLINTDTNDYKENPEVAMDNDGDFVVVWQAEYQDGNGYGVFGQRFNNAGVPQGGEFNISVETTGNQEFPFVDVNDLGEFVVVWESDGHDGSGDGVFARKFDSAGLPMTGDLDIAEDINGDQRNPTVSINNDGDFVVAWRNDANGSQYFQRFDADGSKVGNNTEVGLSQTYYSTHPAVHLDEDGDVIVAAPFSTLSDKYISLTEFDMANTAINTVNDITDGAGGANRRPEIEMDVSGDFVVGWEAYIPGPSGSNVHVRRFNGDFTPKEEYFVAHKIGFGDQYGFDVAVNKQGDIFSVWHDTHGEGNGTYGVSKSFVQVPQEPGVIVNEPSDDILQEDGSNTRDLTYELDFIPNDTVYIELAASPEFDFGAGPNQPFTLEFTECAPQTVTVRAVENAYDEADTLTSSIDATTTSNNTLYNGLTVPSASLRIVDNDTAGVVWSDTSLTVTEGTPGSIEVNLNTIPTETFQLAKGVPAIPTTVDLTVSPQGNTRIDIGQGPGVDLNLQFQGDSTALDPVTIPISVVDDARILGDLNQQLLVTISSSDGKYDVLGLPNINIVGEDNDSAVFNLVDSGVIRNVSEDGVTDTLEWSLSSIPNDTVFLDITPGPQLDVGSGTSTLHRLTFLPDSSAMNVQQVVISTTDDQFVEGTHQDTLGITVVSTDTNFNNVVIPTIDVDITDNDVAQVALTVISGINEVSEDGQTQSVALALLTIPYDAVQVIALPDEEMNVGGGAAVADTLTFLPDASALATQNWDISAFDDAFVEGAHLGTVSFAISSADTNYAILSIGDESFDIEDNDSSAVIITATGGTNEVVEGGDSDTLLVSLSSIPSDTVFVTFDAPEGVAFQPGELESITLTFLPDSTSLTPVDLVFVAIDDIDITGGGLFVFNFTLSSPDPVYDGLVQDPVDVTVEENDTAFVNIVPDNGFLITESGITDSVYISLGTIPYDQVTITLSPGDQVDAGAGVGLPFDLTFSADSSALDSQLVIFSTPDDLIPEGTLVQNVEFTISNTDTNYFNLSLLDLDIQIGDDDAPAFLVVESGGSTTFEEGASDSYEVSLSTPPSDTVEITISAIDPIDLGNGPGADLVMVFLPDTSALNAQTVSVTVAENAIVEGELEAVLSHVVSTLDTNYNQLSLADINLIVVDNDTALILLSESDGSTSVNEGASSDTLMLSLQTIPYETVSIEVSTTEGLDLGSGENVSIMLVFNTDSSSLENQLIPITFPENLAIDTPAIRNLAFTITTADTNYAVLGLSDLGVSIVDNDIPAVLITESEGSSLIQEGEFDDTITVALQTIPQDTVFISVIPGESTLTSTPGTLIFPPSSDALIAQEVVFTTANDTIVEDTTTVLASFLVSSADINYHGIVVNSVSVHIEDNDTAIVPSIVYFVDTTSLELEEGSTINIGLALNHIPEDTVFISISSDTSALEINGEAGGVDATLALTNTDTVYFSVFHAEDTIIESGLGSAILSLTSASGDVDFDGLSLSNVSILLTDNDSLVTIPQVVYGDAENLEVAEGGTTDEFTIQLNVEPSDTVFITLSPDERVDLNGQGAGQDLVLVFTPDASAVAGQTVTIEALNDTIDQQTSSLVSITQSISSNDTGFDSLNLDALLVTVIDDDVDTSTVYTISFPDILIQVNEGTSETYTLSLTTIPDDTVYVTIDPNEFISVEGEEFGESIVIAIPPDSTALDEFLINIAVLDVEQGTGDFIVDLDHTASSLDTNYNNVKSSLEVQVVDPSGEIKLVQALSPNGDGDHDILYIPNIEFYANNEVLIFDAHGSRVAHIIDYNHEDNFWNGDDLLEGTYYVVVLVDGEKNDKASGYIVLKR